MSELEQGACWKWGITLFNQTLFLQECLYVSVHPVLLDRMAIQVRDKHIQLQFMHGSVLQFIHPGIH